MWKYEVCVWLTGPFPSADVTVFLEVTQPVDVAAVSEGVLRLLGVRNASYVVVLDVIEARTSTFRDVVLSV
jgi:hypothetical protein